MSVQAVVRLLAPLRRRVALLLGRAYVRLSDPSGSVQRLQLATLGAEALDGVEHIEAYGFTSRAPGGAEAIIASLGGDRAHTVCLVVGGRAYRLRDLAEGEVAISDDEGRVVWLRRDGILVDASDAVTVRAPGILLDGDVQITGALQVDGATAVAGALSSATSIADPSGSMQSLRGIYNGHGHTYDGSTTSTPNQEM